MMTLFISTCFVFAGQYVTLVNDENRQRMNDEQWMQYDCNSSLALVLGY
jgi:hypothetical protein